MNKQFKSVDILGVRIDVLNMDQAVKRIEEWIEAGKGKYYVVTPNPEFIMAAQRDEEFRKILNNADMAVPDSTRLGWASKVFGERNWLKKILLGPLFLFPSKQLIQFDTVPGVDLMKELCRVASEKSFTVGFLGGSDGVAKKTAECLIKRYPKLKVGFADDGGVVDNEGNVLSSMYYGKKEEIDILFVAFGQVKQEKWIAKNLNLIPVKVAMGVGGSFDEISGKVPRIPDWIYHLGFKWLARLVIQPWRIKRQTALVKFVWNVLK